LVYGDHTPVLPAFSAGTINYDPNTVQEKEVPLIIKLPNETVGKTYADQGTHLDIMPTILDLLGLKPINWCSAKAFMPAAKTFWKFVLTSWLPSKQSWLQFDVG